MCCAESSISFDISDERGRNDISIAKVPFASLCVCFFLFFCFVCSPNLTSVVPRTAVTEISIDNIVIIHGENEYFIYMFIKKYSYTMPN